MSPTEILAEISRLFADRGHLHYGEGVSELEHALQCADMARQAGEQPELILASLLHDVGHLAHDLGERIADQGVDSAHEEGSARLLSAWFGPAVAEPARLHVAAKRYLCRVEPSYLADLSEASLLSLRLQGGPMSGQEASAFEHNPHHLAAIRLRRYDDQAKVPGKAVPDLASYASLIRDLAAKVTGLPRSTPS